MTDSEQCFERLTRQAERTFRASQARICLDEEHRRFIGSGALSRDTLCERACSGDDSALLTAPVVAGDRPIGLFVVEGGRQWTDADRDLLGRFARAAGAEIELEMALREIDYVSPHVRGDR